ncbi:hypothetical protein [Streptomyces sp. NBC_00354]|uniref:hypothetical protein n=1 Tax=Streptomyces sp. NBC_00354 TaxID=2975723 RepID=UPI002E276F87|nr:hypothetical protein OG296_42600 [Streptomyces sp. NBC_01001]
MACEVQLGTTDTPAGYGLAVSLAGVAGDGAPALAAPGGRVCPYWQAVRGYVLLTLLAVDDPATDDRA